MNKSLNNKKLYIVILAVLGLLALISVIQGVRNAAAFSQDFQWDAAKVLSMKINPYDESLNPSGILDEFQFDKYYLQMEANQFPSLLMILFPFTLLEPLTARYVWIVINLLLTAGIVFLLRKTFLEKTDFYEYVALMLLMIAGTPYRNQIGVGQHTLFAFFFFLLAVYFSEKFSKEEDTNKRSIYIILITALCLFICYFKYTLTVPLCIYFIYKKRYLEIGISVVLHVILTFVAAKMLNETFLMMIIKPLKVSSALSAEGGIDFGVLCGGHAISYVLALIVMALLFFISLKIDSQHENTFMALLVLWSLIITYHRTYDFFVLPVCYGMFSETGEAKYNEKFERLSFGVVLLSVFFLLRIFSENAASKVVVGAVYYVYTLFVTIKVLKIANNSKR